MFISKRISGVLSFSILKIISRSSFGSEKAVSSITTKSNCISLNFTDAFVTVFPGVTEIIVNWGH